MPTLMHPGDTNLESTPGGTGDSVVLQSRLLSLHDDPQQIHPLVELLGMPPGTEVRVTTVAASVIVR